MLYRIPPERSEHQPALDVLESSEPTSDELKRTCGTTVAVILATETGETPLVVQFDDPSKEPVVCDSNRDDGGDDGETSGEEPAGEATPDIADDDDFAAAVADLETAHDNAPAVGLPRPLQLYEGMPLVAHAVSTACLSQVAAVRVLVGGDACLRQRIEEAVSQAFDQCAKVTGAARPQVSIVALDERKIDQARKQAANFSLFGLSKAVLDEGRRFLDDFPDASSVFFCACDQVRIEPRHLYAVAKRFAEKPKTNVVTSWITWQRRTPFLVSRAFLEGLDEDPICRLRVDGSQVHAEPQADCPLPPADRSLSQADRPLPALRVEEVVFGEEKLSANAVIPSARARFEEEHTLSALQAVRLAAKLLAEEDANEKADESESEHAGSANEDSANSADSEHQAASVDSADQTSTLKETLDGLNKADRLLVDLALDTLRRQVSFATGEQANRLALADSWGKRNKLDFPLLGARKHRDSLVYLDSAATTQRVGRALDAMRTFDELENANVYRGAYELSAQATASLNDARKVLEDFIGADRRQTVFTMNATDACNMVAQAWGERNIGAGDLIVALISEHHSNLLPWMMLAQRKGAELAFVPLLPDGRVDLRAYDALLERKPKLVCLAHISNVLGIVNPVEDMAARAHRVHARVMLDAAQSLPHIPLNVKDLGCDFMAFSGHKCYGPLGIGGLWIAPEAFDEMDPIAGGGGTISHVSEDSYYLRGGAIQYEAGTPPISQALGLAAALEYLDGLGMDAVVEHGRALTDYLVYGLQPLDYVTVWGDHTALDGQTGLVSISVGGLDPAQVGATMGMVGVAVRSGGHCALPLSACMGVQGTTRISFGVHTTKEDLDAALVAIRLTWLLLGSAHE